MKFIYLDLNTLQVLLNSGTLNSFIQNAIRNGWQVRTSWTILEELRKSPINKLTQAESAFLSDPTKFIPVDIDPLDPGRQIKGIPGIRDSIPGDSGEKGLGALAKQKIAAGQSAIVVTQDGSAMACAGNGGYSRRENGIAQYHQLHDQPAANGNFVGGKGALKNQICFDTVKQLCLIPETHRLVSSK